MVKDEMPSVVATLPPIRHTRAPIVIHSQEREGRTPHSDISTSVMGNSDIELELRDWIKDAKLRIIVVGKLVRKQCAATTLRLHICY